MPSPAPQSEATVSAPERAAVDVRVRIRMRYRKGGDLRWFGHHDMVRSVERWFRRAALPLKMTQGFHPKPKMNFLNPLAVGIAGEDEVMEFELAEDLSAAEVRDRMEQTGPVGLVINEMERITEGTPKPTMRQMTFEVPVPAPRQADVQRRINELLDTHPFPIDRQDGRPTFDLHASCGRLSLADGCLRFDVLASASRSVRPREILAALGIDDLEAAGAVMRRTAMEIT